MNKFIEILMQDSPSNLLDSVYNFLKDSGTENITLWQTEGIICEPILGKHKGLFGSFDMYDLGYEGMPVFSGCKLIESFDESVPINHAVYIESNQGICIVITVHQEELPEAVIELSKISNFIAKRYDELTARDSNINVYVDYQKKIEFIKKASVIFKSIEVQEVIATSLSFFMDVFAAEAAGCLYGENFNGFGVDRDDLVFNVSLNGEPVVEYLERLDATEYIDEGLESLKFNVDNAFFVYEKTIGMKIILFNIHFDTVPDKEFSELVSSVVSIAVENALNHEEMTKFKVEESEMNATAEILSKFVTKEIELKDTTPSLKGISYPAKSAGGDYLSVVDFEDRMFFCVADVCGKGYSAAVFTVVLSVINDMQNFEELDAEMLSKIMTQANSYLIEKQFSNRFITAFFGVYNKSESTLCYISCGHEPSMLIKPDGSKTDLMSAYLPMGIMEEEYSSACVKIEKGDSLFVYTDGIIEYIDEDELFRRICSDQSPDFVNRLYADLVTDKDSQKDDFTCMYLKF